MQGRHGQGPGRFKIVRFTFDIGLGLVWFRLSRLNGLVWFTFEIWIGMVRPFLLFHNWGSCPDLGIAIFEVIGWLLYFREKKSVSG